MLTRSGLNLSLSCFELVLGFVLTAFIRRTREFRTYWPLVCIYMSSATPFLLLMLLRQLHSMHRGFSADMSYDLYFWTYWCFFAVEATTSVILIYNIFNSAMRPLKGLQDLGKIVFFWVAGISLALGISGSLIPQDDRYGGVIIIVTQAVRASSILVLSMLLFVCFSIRPMGLSYRSRVFGVSAGLTIIASVNIIQAAYLMRVHGMFSNYAIFQTVMQCIAELVWIYYFAVPEPKRKFVLLPTTSPFHKWNMISELLGHEPGYVAIGGIAPEEFASAEIEIFHRASAKMPKLAVPTVPQPVPPEQWLRSGDK